MAHGRSTLLAATLALLALPTVASAAEASKLEATWEVAPRFSQTVPGAGPREPAAAAAPTSLDVALVVGASGCAEHERYRIKVDAARTVEVAGADCRFTRSVPAGEVTKIGIRRLSNNALAQLEVEPRDVLVVSVGDSVASGEGNPDREGDWSLRRPIWLDRRCHRSLKSGHARAAYALEKADPHTSVTFVPLACSGATVVDGLTPAGAMGQEPLGLTEPLPAQLDELGRLGRKPGAVLLSVGGNDVQFATIIRFCRAVGDCREALFDPTTPDRAARDGRKIGAVVDAALVRLRERYGAVRTKLGDLNQRVIVTDYFDPTRDTDGEHCERMVMGMVSRVEAQWAYERVLLELNRRLREAADAAGWRMVTGVAQAFRTHGYCAGRDRWVRTLKDSIRVQGRSSNGAWSVGAMHPNGAGHATIAELLTPALLTTVAATSATAGSDAPTAKDEAKPKKDDITADTIEDVLLPWLPLLVGILLAWAVLWRVVRAWSWKRPFRSIGAGFRFPRAPTATEAIRILLGVLALVLLAAQLIVKDEVDTIAAGMLIAVLVLVILPEIVELTGFGVTVKMRDAVKATDEEKAAAGIAGEDEDDAGGDDDRRTRLPKSVYLRALDAPREGLAEGAARLQRRLLFLDDHFLGRNNPISHVGVASDLEEQGLLSAAATKLVAIALANANTLVGQPEVSVQQAIDALELLDRAYAALTPRVVHHLAVRKALEKRGYDVTEVAGTRRGLPDLLVAYEGTTALVAPRAWTSADPKSVNATIARLAKKERYAARAVVLPKRSALLTSETLTTTDGVQVVSISDVRAKGFSLFG